ncbi:MAG: hypothetical protein V3V09_02340 [Arenicellales bacterium]
MTQNNTRRKLITIFAWFFIPLLAASMWYKFFPAPTGKTNNGDLIESIFTLEPFEHQSIAGKVFSNIDTEKVWTLVHFVEGECDEACSQTLYNTRQMRISFGKDIKRLKRVAVVDVAAQTISNQKMWASHPDLTVVVKTDNGIRAQIMEKVTDVKIEAQSIFLVDPLGNVMMHFPSSLETKLMKKDIKKLLKLSHIG